jgi:hypothetical protein
MARRVTAKQDRGKLIYVYGIAQGRVAALGLPQGVDGRAPVEAIPCDSLTCLISRVDATEFGSELSTHMENLNWLAGAGVRHQQVVAAIYARAPILPARFATMFSSEDALAADVRRRKRELLATFKAVQDADEYGIKIFAVPVSETAGPPAASGKEYLRRKSEQLQARSARKPTPELESLIGSLQRIASETTPGGKASAGQPHLVWQASLLVPRSRRKKLEELLTDAAGRLRRKYRIECSGPWPPYSFVKGKPHAESA